MHQRVISRLCFSKDGSELSARICRSVLVFWAGNELMVMGSSHHDELVKANGNFLSDLSQKDELTVEEIAACVEPW